MTLEIGASSFKSTVLLRQSALLIDDGERKIPVSILLTIRLAMRTHRTPDLFHCNVGLKFLTRE